MQIKAIELKNVSFSYSGEKTLSGISFSVEEGDFACIIGPNGAGKTTLAKIILGILQPDKGSVAIFGKKISEAESGLIGYVPQKISVDPNFPATAGELLDLSCTKENRAEIVSLLGLEGVMGKKFSELSGGQQQRVIAGMALSKKPRILILDEPASGIDIGGQEKFGKFLEQLNKKNRTTIILVSHDIGLVSKQAKTVICMNKNLCGIGPSSKLPEFLHNMYGKDYKFHHHHEPDHEGENDA